MQQELYSVEQVAERLGLHVRTVRNYVREGRLKAVRIGKQYRIARADLDALTGAPPLDAARRRHVEVSSIVQVDDIRPDLADRISTVVLAAANAPRDGEDPLRLQTLYDAGRARLKVVVLGSPGDTAELLRLIDTLMEGENG